jgi:hypothetical protein
MPICINIKTIIIKLHRIGVDWLLLSNQKAPQGVFFYFKEKINENRKIGKIKLFKDR